MSERTQNPGISHPFWALSVQVRGSLLTACYEGEVRR